MSRQSHAPILLTRAKAQSLRFAKELAATLPYAPIVISPLIAPEIIPAAPPLGAFSAVIFTSETGVLGTQMQPLPPLAYCVGQRTADAATAAGFVVRASQGDWRNLYDLIIQENISGRFLFLHAEEAAPDLPNALNSAGRETVSVAVYRQKACALSEKASDLLRRSQSVIVPLFSARSAALFCQEYKRIDGAASLYIAAFSDQVAVAVGVKVAEIQTAAHPTVDEMLATVQKLATLC